jgi:hypothetical protein
MVVNPRKGCLWYTPRCLRKEEGSTNYHAATGPNGRRHRDIAGGGPVQEKSVVRVSVDRHTVFTKSRTAPLTLARSHAPQSRLLKVTHGINPSKAHMWWVLVHGGCSLSVLGRVFRCANPSDPWKTLGL